MKQKQSAKDIAFEKERVKFRKKIRELEHDLASTKCLVMQKDDELSTLRSELSQKEDWIRRLLEYTELSEQDIRTIIQEEKSHEQTIKMFKELGDVISSISRMRGMI